MDLRVGSVCDRGLNPRRPVNQDCLLVLPDLGFFAVFDGVGGHQAGEVASRTAAETIEEVLRQRGSTSSSPVEIVKQAISLANRDVIELAGADPAFRTMATTVALAKVAGDCATVAHVGDSRVYLYEKGRLHRKTVDHTDQQLFGGAVTKAESHAINRALGAEPDTEAEISSIKLREGSRLLLCTDGIYRHLSDEEMARVLSDTADPQHAAERLKRLVYERGADDNLSAIVVQVGNVAADAPPAPQRNTAAVANSRIHVDFGFRRSDMEYDPNWRVQRRWLWVATSLLLIGISFFAGWAASSRLNGRGPDSTAPSLEQQGKDQFNSGNFQGAAISFTAVLERDPRNTNALYWLGRSQLEQGSCGEAAVTLERAGATETGPHDAYAQAAAAYHCAGNEAKAREMLRLYSEARKRPRG